MGDNDFALARYNPDGSLDTSFSGDGRQTTGFTSRAEAYGLAIQGNGKIVAVGSTYSATDPGDFAVARYNPDGSLDASFSGDGRETTNVGGFDGANAVVLQGGKIVAAGDGGFAFALARYNPNGTLDPSFSGDGKQTTDFGGTDEANDVALQGAKIVVVGRGGPGEDFTLARYNTNGSLDASFSGDGKDTADFGGDDGATAVVVQGTGKAVVVGAGGAGGDFALARYNTNATLDTTFSGDGKQTTDFGGDFDGAYGVALQGDGRIVAAGFAGSFGRGPADDFALARYNFDGSLDPSFSGDGKLTTNFAGNEGAGAVAVQADGKLVVVGAGGDFALARYNPDGSLDTTFSGDGQQTTDFGALDGANGVAIQGDGKIVVAGRGAFGGDFALARYNPNGTLDTTFSGDGKQTTAFVTNDGANDVALQPNGKIVVVGFAGGAGRPSFNFALARYNPNGSLDTSFSGDGRQTTDFGGGEAANGVALQPNGKIVAVGGGGTFTLARYNANGTLDTTFSGDGKQTGGSLTLANAVALQADGRIVAVGLGGGGGDAFASALARYNPDGSFDTTFSGDGQQTTDFGGTDEANDVALQGAKIVVVGRGGPGEDFTLARYNSNGTLDPSFSGDGKLTTDFGGTDEGTDWRFRQARSSRSGTASAPM